MESRLPAHTPLFLLGFPRSGTTLLRLHLDAHSRLAIPFESFVLIDFWRRLPQYDLATANGRSRLVGDLLSAKGIRVWNPRVLPDDVDLDRCGSYADVIDQIYGAYARRCGKPRWGDKTPSYTRDFHILHQLFPEARFIHLVRDGRDAALSLVRQPWGPGDFISALSQWNEILQWSRKMGRCLPNGSYLEVRYEDLVSEPEQTLRTITSFLDLPFEQSMLTANTRVADKMPRVALAYHQNAARPLNGNHVYGWQEQLSRTDQAIALRVAGEVLQDLGYPAAPVRVARWQVDARRAWLWGSAGFGWRLRQLRKRLGFSDTRAAQPRQKHS